jgi:hypothetical protein
MKKNLDMNFRDPTFQELFPLAHANSAKPSLAQEDDSFLIYPFENTSEEEKDKVIKGFLELTAKHSLQIFKSLGLKVGFEGTVIEDTTGDKFEFSFKKIV